VDFGKKMNCKSLILLTSLLISPCYASLDYAAWSDYNADGSWTRATETAVSQSGLAKTVPADIREFCPRYQQLSTKERRKFWVGLLSAMAKPESGFKPEISYQERFTDGKGKRVISRGLLQISIESANQKRYDCDIPHAGLLHDPIVNLSCGVKILAKWVKEDGVIASKVKAGTHKGGGRYWSTLRQQTGHLDTIRHFTRELPICRSR